MRPVCSPVHHKQVSVIEFPDGHGPLKPTVHSSKLGSKNICTGSLFTPGRDTVRVRKREKSCLCRALHVGVLHHRKLSMSYSSVLVSQLGSITSIMNISVSYIKLEYFDQLAEVMKKIQPYFSGKALRGAR